MAFSDILAYNIDFPGKYLIQLKSEREPQEDDFPDQIDYHEFQSKRNGRVVIMRRGILTGITSI